MTENQATPTLTLPNGQIKGTVRQSIYDKSYYSFEGIPYGKPPLGELRFKAPQPAAAWTGVRDCTDFAIKPVQKNHLTGVVEGSEDCLYLNVYAKTLKSDKPLPVMVFIYGGGFYMGEATRDLYSPDYFMFKDVILVTFNYRLCALGFLSLNDPALEVPGNAALKDQVLALKWVKQHIALFNGDPANITVFGESAGGASTHYMLTTPQTRGLFQKAIAMSGCILNPWANMQQTHLPFRLAQYHGYKGENVDTDVLAFLRTLEPGKLVSQEILTLEERRNGILFPFGPCVEAFVGEDCVVSKTPLESLKTAWSNEIPIMIGGASFEGLLMYPRFKLFAQNLSALGKEPVLLLPAEVRAANTDEENKELAQTLVKIHFGNKEPNEHTLFDFLDLFSYQTFWHGFHRTILSRLAYGKGPTYLYRFDFDSPDFNHYRTKFCGKDPVRGVAHADDLSYLFFSNFSWELKPDSSEFKTIERMIGIWTAFAKQSDPNCDEIKPALWKPLDSANPHIALNISEEVKVVELPERKKLAVWDSLYRKVDLF